MGSLNVCIDAGHGGTDPGAVLGKRYEKDDALKFAKRLGKVLEANGVNVSYTRTSDTYNTPGQKAAKGNSSGADLFVSIHRNAAANKEATGAEVLVYKKTGIKNEIAANICAGYKKLGFVDRGVKENPGLTVLNKTKMQALLIEVGFITNTADNDLFDEKFYSLVNVVAREICRSYKIDFKTITELKK